jgi:hypothetical protein
MPTVVTNLLSRIGLGLSETTMRNTIDSLSGHAKSRLRQLGSQLVFALAYDNLDIELSHTVSTLEREAAGPSLIHLTSATLLPLHPSIKPEHLNYSSEQ